MRSANMDTLIAIGTLTAFAFLTRAARHSRTLGRLLDDAALLALIEAAWAASARKSGRPSRGLEVTTLGPSPT